MEFTVTRQTHCWLLYGGMAAIASGGWMMGLVLIYLHRLQVCRETLVIHDNLGISLKTVQQNGQVTDEFVALDEIQTIVLAEGLYRFQYKFYLAVVQRNELTVLFKHTMPRLHVLEKIHCKLLEALKVA
jgi:hypothetical protein